MAERKASGTTKTAGTTGKSKSTSTAKSRSKRAAELEAQRIREEALRRDKRRRHITSVVLLAVGVVLTLLAIIPGSMGWKALFNVMHGLFGFAAYAVGPLLIYAAVVISAGRRTIASTMLRTVLFMLMLCAAVEIISVGAVRGDNFGEVFVNLYKNGVEFSGGGVFALIFGVPLLFLGRLGATVIIIIVALVCVLLIVNIPLPELFSRIRGFFGRVGENVAERNERRREDAAIADEEYRRVRMEKQLERERRAQERSMSGRSAQVGRSEFTDNDLERERKLADMRDVVNSVGKPTAEPSAKPEQSEMPEPLDLDRAQSVRLPEQSGAEEFIEEQKQDNREYREALKKYMEKRHPIMRDPEPPEPPDPSRYEDNDADLVPIIDALDKLNSEKIPARVSKIVDAPKSGITDSDKLAAAEAESVITEPANEPVSVVDDVDDDAELPFDLDDLINDNRPLEGTSGFVEPPVPRQSDQPNRQLTLSDVYTLPPMSLLNEVKKPVRQADIDIEIRRNADKLVETLKSFGVQTTYLGASRGPSVTRYELQPAPGVKISKISNLADDVALNLAVSGVRIAPVPDKAAVGIEIPNKVKDTVFFRELVDTPAFRSRSTGSLKRYSERTSAVTALPAISRKCRTCSSRERRARANPFA